MPRSAFKDGRTQVRVAGNGSVSVPKPYREALGLEQGTVLEAALVDGSLVFTPKALSDWEGREAYLEAKSNEKAGRLSPGFSSVKDGMAHLRKAATRRSTKKVARSTRAKKR